MKAPRSVIHPAHSPYTPLPPRAPLTPPGRHKHPRVARGRRIQLTAGGGAPSIMHVLLRGWRTAAATVWRGGGEGVA